MKFNQKNTGFLLIGFSVVLLIVLGFVKANVDEQSAFLCEAVSANPDLDMAECPAHKNTTSWLLVVAFGVSFLIIGAGLYMSFMPMKREEGVSKAVISKLDQHERSIHELLQQSDGSMYQSDIIKETGFSKVKTTRILDRLEGKKIIERKRRGMTNIIVLR